jgi:peptidoglycan/LPS O-acetylase OafA/YrhL
VLLYHGYGGDLFKGSFLAVSTFFTLSGFLITSLLLTEQSRSGGIALSSFYARRLRRLLPASAAILGAVMLTAFFTNEGWERSLGGDVFAAGLHVANWRFIANDFAYGDLFNSDPPLVLHFWSLAIEEQFYWVFPLITAGALYLFRGSLKAYTGVMAGLIGCSLLLTLFYADNGTVVYYATPIRGGEILMGGLFAVLVARGFFLSTRRWAPWIAGIGVVVLASQLLMWWFVTQSDPSLKWGGLLAYSFTSGLLVLSANVDGPVRRLMSFEPLRLLGVVSYGVYLFHWPLFLLMSPERVDGWLKVVGLGSLQPRTWKLMILRLVVVLVLAAVSYRWFESPIRRGRRPKRLNPQLFAIGGVVGVLVLAVAVPKISEPPIDPFTSYIHAIDGADPSSLTAGSRVGVLIGDSTMVKTAAGLTEWGKHYKDVQVFKGGSAENGCSVGDEGSVRYRGQEMPLRVDPCSLWRSRLFKDINDDRDRYGRVDFAVVLSGPWDVADRRIPGSDEWVHIGEKGYDDYLRKEMEDVIDAVASEGMTVVWLTSPDLDWHQLDPPVDERPPEFDPARMALYNDMIRELAAQHEGVVVVDLAAHAAELGPEKMAELRFDGVHFDDAGALEIAQWLGPEILKAAAAEHPPATTP